MMGMKIDVLFESLKMTINGQKSEGLEIVLVMQNVQLHYNAPHAIR